MPFGLHFGLSAIHFGLRNKPEKLAKILEDPYVSQIADVEYMATLLHCRSKTTEIPKFILTCDLPYKDELTDFVANLKKHSDKIAPNTRFQILFRNKHWCCADIMVLPNGQISIVIVDTLGIFGSGGSNILLIAEVFEEYFGKNKVNIKCTTPPIQDDFKSCLPLTADIALHLEKIPGKELHGLPAEIYDERSNKLPFFVQARTMLPSWGTWSESEWEQKWAHIVDLFSAKQFFNTSEGSCNKLAAILARNVQNQKTGEKIAQTDIVTQQVTTKGKTLQQYWEKHPGHDSRKLSPAEYDKCASKYKERRFREKTAAALKTMSQSVYQEILAQRKNVARLFPNAQQSSEAEQPKKDPLLGQQILPTKKSAIATHQSPWPYIWSFWHHGCGQQNQTAETKSEQVQSSKLSSELQENPEKKTEECSPRENDSRCWGSL
jgi:DNA-binding transcriptional regulator YbjK